MKTPPEERRADSDAEPPGFDALDEPGALVRKGQTRDRIYTTVLQLDEPASVAEVAERSDASPDATRDYLRWFADVGLVERVGERPAEYVVDRGFLTWRRASRLSKEHSEPELVRRLQDATETIQSYRDEYGVGSPSEVVIDRVSRDTDTPVADVWEEVSAWETAVQRRGILELALRMHRRNDPLDGSSGRAESSESGDVETTH